MLSLQFDGFFVRERPGRLLDLAAVKEAIRRDTGYDMDVVEKPLFSDVWPTLTLRRASGGNAKRGGGAAPAPGPAAAAARRCSTRRPRRCWRRAPRRPRCSTTPPPTRRRADALVAALDPGVVAAGIVPLAEGGLWLSLQTMPRGAPVGEPGGKRDARDATLWETAVREREETGLDFGGARLERADQIFYGSSRTGLNYVFFFVAAPGAPRLTGDRRIVEHRLWHELPPADALPPRPQLRHRHARLRECLRRPPRRRRRRLRRPRRRLHY